MHVISFFFAVVSLVPYFAVLCLALVVALRFAFGSVRRGMVGFFHPHAEDGGGGERVLWSAVKALQASYPHLRIVIFTKDGFSSEDLTSRAMRNFNLKIESAVQVMPLKRVAWLDPQRYPHLTLIYQSIASFFVAWEGLQLLVPEVWVDTSGWAFSYPLAWWLGCRVACYVHYPTISTDMLSRVQSGASMYNNDRQIAKSRVLTVAKLMYYRGFAAWYGFMGSFAQVVMVNSTWTQNHIQHLWRRESVIVYPPVDTLSLQELSLERSLETPCLISVAQFRPEKNHALQIKAYAKAVDSARKTSSQSNDSILSSKLKIVGSCRNEGDRARLQKLRDLVGDVHLQSHVEFFESVPFEELRHLLGGAVAGLHTMVDEHFGIGVVEYMAAGVIPIAHRSGGPQLDILSPTPGTTELHGYLRTTLDEYADAIYEVLTMPEMQRRAIAGRCREKAQLFSQENFESGFLKALKAALQ